nr:sigma 54-interacting transcriptional regulator [Planococcus ruber]
MDDLYEIVKGTDSIIAFSDPDGVILELFGDSDIALNAASANFKIGANMNEKHSGTNAIGTALVTGSPIQVIGAEHFCVAWHTSHCSSAPILDPLTGNVLGVLTVVGYLKTAHPHSLALVKTAAGSVLKLIEQKELKHEQYMVDNYFNAAIDSISDGILIVNRIGEVIRLNKIAAHLLGISSEPNTKYKLNDIAKLKPLSKNLQEMITGQEVILKEQLNLQQDGEFLLLLTSRKIQVGKETIGNIIILQKKFKKDINNFTAKHQFSSLIGEDPEFKKTIRFAEKAARTDKTILLTGESGTGKELFAQAIHNDSSRRQEAFLAVNCAAIPRELIASELFGYTDGAFTNAVKGGKKGKFEAAHGGTVFLDEIGDMPLEVQTHLLRVLEEKEVTPLGSNQPKSINVRIIAATNKNLKELVENKEFRLDLFYRLNIISLDIPPLRNRKSDIPILANYFLPYKKLSAEVLSEFYTYEWPGNLRELKNVLEQMEVFCESDLLTIDYLPGYLKKGKQTFEVPEFYSGAVNQTRKQTLLLSLKSSSNAAEAAEKLGVSPSTVYRWAEEYGINLKMHLKRKEQ